jgi:hypothetical protein
MSLKDDNLSLKPVGCFTFVDDIICHNICAQTGIYKLLQAQGTELIMWNLENRKLSFGEKEEIFFIIRIWSLTLWLLSYPSACSALLYPTEETVLD